MRTPHGKVTAAPHAAWLVACAAGLTTLSTYAQSPASIRVTVRETAGIRRTEYPVSTVVSWPRGAVSDVGRLRLRAADATGAGAAGTAGADILAQFTPAARWDDGSLRHVEVDFNASIGAGERRGLRVLVAASSDAAAPAAPRNALSVAEGLDGYSVGAVRLGRRAWPLLASVAYRGEIIGNGPNGIVLVDAAGTEHRFGEGDVQAEVVKPGPLLVKIRYTGRLTVGTGVAIPVTLSAEMPNSKSWIKLALRVDDPARRVRHIRVATPFALGSFPWLWDFGTDSGSYGVFRSPADRVVLTQRVGPATRTGWQIENGSGADLRVYEQSTPRRDPIVGGWGHLLDGRNAIAFAVDRFGAQPGTYTYSLNGDGGLAYDVAPVPSATRHDVVYYQHYVGTPVPIGAATSPAAMLAPLVVGVERE